MDGELVINPTPEQMAESDLDIVTAGRRGALVMVEGGAKEVNESDILNALKTAHTEIVKGIDAQEELQKKVGKEKITVAEAPDTAALEAQVREKAEARLSDAVRITTKGERYTAIAEVEKEVLHGIASDYRSAPCKIDSLAASEPRRAGLPRLTAQVQDVPLRGGLRHSVRLRPAAKGKTQGQYEGSCGRDRQPAGRQTNGSGGGHAAPGHFSKNADREVSMS